MPKGWILVIGFCWTLLILVAISVRRPEPLDSLQSGSIARAEIIPSGFIACAPAWPGDAAFAATPFPWPGDPGFWFARPVLPLDSNACTGSDTPVPLIVMPAP